MRYVISELIGHPCLPFGKPVNFKVTAWIPAQDHDRLAASLKLDSLALGLQTWLTGLFYLGLMNGFWQLTIHSDSLHEYCSVRKGIGTSLGLGWLARCLIYIFATCSHPRFRSFLQYFRWILWLHLSVGRMHPLLPTICSQLRLFFLCDFSHCDFYFSSADYTFDPLIPGDMFYGFQFEKLTMLMFFLNYNNNKKKSNKELFWRATFFIFFSPLLVGRSICRLYYQFIYLIIKIK